MYCRFLAAADRILAIFIAVTLLRREVAASQPATPPDYAIVFEPLLIARRATPLPSIRRHGFIFHSHIAIAEVSFFFAPRH